jgi:hypothetical protein
VKYPDPEIAEYKPCETCTNSWKEIIEAKKNVFRAEAAEYLKKVIEEKEAKAAETKANEEIAEYKPCETCTNSWKEIIEDKKNVFGAEAAEYLKKVIEEKEAKAAETKAAEAKAAETKANE